MTEWTDLIQEIQKFNRVKYQNITTEIARILFEFSQRQVHVSEERSRELLEYLVVIGYTCGKTKILEEIEPGIKKMKELKEML
tara:strand:- start:508 stop:756 length:249 start_codon:yes stop_codon:yes gene_type:complete